MTLEIFPFLLLFLSRSDDKRMEDVSHMFLRRPAMAGSIHVKEKKTIQYSSFFPKKEKESHRLGKDNTCHLCHTYIVLSSSLSRGTVWQDQIKQPEKENESEQKGRQYNRITNTNTCVRYQCSNRKEKKTIYI